ncbi:hypothetical protein EIP86_009977 [Pleurotus ostreatoroseus]|nr:hypothetical protein EIP86_009977 [Pleurotus ostreatoroseus]
MPEGFMIAYNAREIRAHADAKGQKSGLAAEDPLEHECLAREQGARPSVSTHRCSDDDEVFRPLPKERTRKGSSKKQVAGASNVCTLCAAPDSDDIEEDVNEAVTGEVGILKQVSKENDSQIGTQIAEGADPGLNTQHATGFEGLIQMDVKEDTVFAVPTDYAHLKGKSAAQIANGMGIRGKLYCAFRGKELVLFIGRFAMRVNFAMEGHCLWIPTDQYRSIVSHPAISRGKKSKSFAIPEEFCDKPKNSDPITISIQAAFVRPEWTLLFVDHNVMISFHVMWLREEAGPGDVVPGGKLWNYVWSETHGPVHLHEPEAADAALEAWRTAILGAESQDYEPIFTRIKGNQKVFNGYGAQETTDMLFTACIHPRMPTYLVCKDDALWSSLKSRTFGYQEERIAALWASKKVNRANGSKKAGYPYVSGSLAFRMNVKGHARFLSDVPVFRRKEVRIDQTTLDLLLARGLLDPDATIQDNGYALKQEGEESIWQEDLKPSPPPIGCDPRCKRVSLTNYAHYVVVGTRRGQERRIPMYSPFVAQAPSTWFDRTDVRSVEVDVAQEVNDTTIGPYSFRVFVDCGYTRKYTVEAERPKGRRALLQIDGGVRKRLKVEDWGGRENLTSKSTVILGKLEPGILEDAANREETVEEVIEVKGYVTPSGRRLRARKC